MTMAATAPSLTKELNAELNALPMSNNSGTWNACSELANSTRPGISQSGQLETRHIVVRMSVVVTDWNTNIFQYGTDKDALILIDFKEPEDEFPRDHLETIRFLRANGRPILADQLVELLRDAEEDPDEVKIKVVSLRDMARLLMQHKDFDDPSIGSDGWGVVHAQWRIKGNGLLVMSFLDRGEVLLTARANEGPGQDKLRISRRVHAQDIVREYGHLVPLRN